MPWHDRTGRQRQAIARTGLWLKESAHGQGFGREVVAALAEWAHKNLGKESFICPIAVQNTAQAHGRRVPWRNHRKPNKSEIRVRRLRDSLEALSILFPQPTRENDEEKAQRCVKPIYQFSPVGHARSQEYLEPCCF